MKKLLKVVLIICLFGIFDFSVMADTVPTLQQISDKFNNHSTIKEYAKMGATWKATTSDNKLIVTASANESSTTIEFILNDNILSSTVAKDDLLTGSVVTSLVIDCVSQFHGYSENELDSTLQSEKIAEYTLANEGLEMSQSSSGELNVKIDISKKIPLLDLSGEYLEVEDLTMFKEYIAGDGSAERRKGNVWFNKSGYDGDNTVLVAEKNNLTESSYKSILSIIEVMFDSKDVVDYFKNNYPSISSDKEFTGFKIEINPTKTSWEQSLIPDDSGYKFLRISIDKAEVNNRNSQNGNVNNDTEDDNINDNSNQNNDNEYNSSNTVESPKTGLESHITILLLLVLIGSAIIYSLKNKNKFKKI